MALYYSTSKSVYLYPLRLLGFAKMQPYLYSFVHQSIKDDSGVLDDFTSQLVHRNGTKWERRKTVAQKKIKCNIIVADIAKNNIANTIESLNIDAINELFQKAIDYMDSSTLLNLTKQCITYDKVPSLSILLQALSVCSQQGDKNTIIDISQLCEKVRPEILMENSNFEHYIAEAVWIKGNVEKSLKMFETVYNENIYLRRRIRSILKRLILDSVKKHSEATMVNLLHFSEMLVLKYNDYFTLGCLWQACILSEWFTDQQIALDLLNKHADLCNVIINKIPFVIGMSLRHDRTEVVYRLIELLLKFKMESEIGQVILALLDYLIRKGDFRQCKEILLWSIQNDIKVPTILNEKLMRLLNTDVETKFKSDSPKRTTTDYKF